MFLRISLGKQPHNTALCSCKYLRTFNKITERKLCSALLKALLFHLAPSSTPLPLPLPPSTTGPECAVHRVDRVLRFFSSRRNWDSPTPSPAGNVPPYSWSGGHEFKSAVWTCSVHSLKVERPLGWDLSTVVTLTWSCHVWYAARGVSGYGCATHAPWHLTGRLTCLKTHLLDAKADNTFLYLLCWRELCREAFWDR